MQFVGYLGVKLLKYIYLLQMYMLLSLLSVVLPLPVEWLLLL